MAKHRHSYRRRNPFAAGSLQKLAVKVTGALGGAIAASTIPSMLSPGLSSGWAGVGFALAIAFGGSYVLKSASMDLAEGVLIGGALQAASRAVSIVTGKTLLTAGLGQYGPLNFTIPTPAYSLPSAAPAIAASASKTSGARSMSPALAGRRQVYSKWVS